MDAIDQMQYAISVNGIRKNTTTGKKGNATMPYHADRRLLLELVPDQLESSRCLAGVSDATVSDSWARMAVSLAGHVPDSDGCR